MLLGYLQRKKLPIDARVIFGIWIHAQKGLFALCHLQHDSWTTWFEAANRRGNTAQPGHTCQQFSIYSQHVEHLLVHQN